MAEHRSRSSDGESLGEESVNEFEWRDKFAPIIYMLDEGPNSLECVLLERNPLCDIYWFKWPHDGYLFYTIADYEPVVIVFEKESAYGIITRPHWDYKTYRLTDGLSMPIEVMFKGASHAPYPKIIEAADRFMIECEGLVRRNYEPEPINTADITSMYRTGTAHPSNLRLIVKDPIVRATELYDEFKDD